jgi:hypothetical protein
MKAGTHSANITLLVDPVEAMAAVEASPAMLQ